MAERLEKILVSACLMGEPVRYNGLSKRFSNPFLARWHEEDRLVYVCPEVNGGLPVPRPAAEIMHGNSQEVLHGNASVMTRDSQDVTDYFLAGAQHALALCEQHRVKIAILKENSPSCGSSMVHDGSFTGKLIRGEGITAAVLRQAGILVFSEAQINEAASALDSISTS